MTAGIGTRSVVVDGVYTGELDGPFCYGPGKVEAMSEIARWEGLDLAQCYAYSDSASDLPMLEAVGHPVAVNPDAAARRATRGQRMADRALQPAHEGRHPPRRGRVSRRRPSAPPGSPAAMRVRAPRLAAIDGRSRSGSLAVASPR